jgi:hypothetical protein
MSDSVLERLRSRLVADGECMVWTGAKSGGYGQIRVNGRLIYAHRLAYQLKHGSIPDGALVLHSCDNRPCCNTDHLAIGDEAANHRDAMSRDRHSRGMRHGMSKLTDDDVRRIRCIGRGMRQRDAAAMFGVTQKVVSRILRGVAWRHVT